MLLLDIFFSFAIIGLCSFGGGYAMLSFLQNTVVEKGWMSVEAFADMIAISQVTPGPIAINMATFVGYKLDGMIGSIVATLGIIIPTFTLVLLLATVFFRFDRTPVFQGILSGLRPTVIGLVATAVIAVGRIALQTKTGVNIPAAVITILVILGNLKRINPFLLIGLSGIAGILFL